MRIVPLGRLIRRIAPRSALCALGLILALPSLVLQISSAQAQERRVALVIGNSRYDDGVSELSNPTNDADDVAEALKAMNFEVTELKDLSDRDFHKALQEFSRETSTANTALVYYAGHAMHLDDESYLMPVGVQVKDKADVKFEMVSVEDDIIRRTLADVPVKILILDACRDNPIAKQIGKVDKSRSASDVRGLAPIVQFASGMLIAYATSPNQVAEDGQGRNSPFTKALKRHIREPGVDIQTMLAEVSADVRQDTNGRQRPEISDALPRGFFLSPGESDAVVWDSIKSTHNVDELKNFVRRFPASQHVGEANAKIEVLLVQEQLEQFKREAAQRDEAARKQADEARTAVEALQRAEAAAKEAARQQAAAEAEAKRLGAEQDAARKDELRKAEADRVAAAKAETARQEAVKAAASKAAEAARQDADRVTTEKAAAAAQAVQAGNQRQEPEKAAPAIVHQPSPEELAQQREKAEKDRVAAAQAQAVAKEAARQRAEREAAAEQARARVEKRRREAAAEAAEAAAEARAARRAAQAKAAQAERAASAASEAHRAAQAVAVRSRRTEHVERASAASPHSCFNFNGKSYCE